MAWLKRPVQTTTMARLISRHRSNGHFVLGSLQRNELGRVAFPEPIQKPQHVPVLSLLGILLNGLHNLLPSRSHLDLAEAVVLNRTPDSLSST